jgi:uncharacterized protein
LPNRLADETSPYLQQHRDNPVDWYPWGKEALARARTEARPILLSVGYSACHWCHVMAHESFEDEATARAMSARFVCIKVDREERPDLDEIYMKAVQAFTGGHGGWPMTVFLTPDGRPFFGGTYFPPEPRQGMPSFLQVMDRAEQMYRRYKGKQLDEMTDQLLASIASQSRLPAPAKSLEGDWLDSLQRGAEEDFDEAEGGFSGAPKFPPHGTLAALLLRSARGDRRALEMVARTLDGMIKGGMYDHVGGGFARYSVDGEWRIPHFEKMLYDNAQLVPLYVDAGTITGAAHYHRIARETCDFVLRDLALSGGGFTSALDADSEHKEGKAYVWTPRELREVLGLMDGSRAAMLLQVTDEGTFEHGTSVLRLESPLETLDESDRNLLIAAFPKLKAVRDRRVQPGRDDKVLTAWNALMISALAHAGFALDERRFVDAAVRAATFIETNLVRDGRLLRTWRDGKAHLLAYADDHAFLAQACLDLYETTFDLRWLERSLHWADQLVDLFWDHADGGLFYTGRDAEALVATSKHPIGGAEPSANGVAALAFARLAVMCGRADLGDKSETILRSLQGIAKRAPRALGPEFLAYAWRTTPPRELGIAGEPDAEDTRTLLAEVRRRVLPLTVRAVVASDTPLVPWMAERPRNRGRATAYLCEAMTCQLPTSDPKELAALLDDKPKEAQPLRDHAPELPSAADSWINATPMSLADLRGSVVVLDFWTYACINCMHVLPVLAEVEAAFEGEPLVVIGVHANKFPTEAEREHVVRAVARHHVRHPVVLDPGHDLWDRYTIRAWPSLVVLDTTGRIAWRKSGEVTREELTAVVRRLLDDARTDGTIGKPPAVVPPVHEDTSFLAFPGKVSVYPGVQAQMRGVAPWSNETHLYVSDTGHHRIHETRLTLGSDGWPSVHLVRTFGTGQPGLVDGAHAQFRGPQGTSRIGNSLWVADTENHALRRIDLATGVTETIAGTGSLARGPSKSNDPKKLPLRSPWDVEAQDKVVFIAMAGSHQLWVCTEGGVGPFVGSGREDHVDGPANEAALAQPSGLVLSGRYIFFADSEVSSVRLFDLQERRVGTVVGAGLFDFGDVDGPADQVRLQHPLDVTVSGSALYVADTFNGKVKAISLEDGTTRTLASGFSEPGGIDALGGFLFVADTNNHRVRVVRADSGEVRDLPLHLPL